MHQVVDMAPSFSLKNQNGELVSLEDFRGQWVIL
ncbi:MAG: redoxin domain-containing protein, partial [Simkania sp.]|nr:redoxin domain-containing protein [Simkania sp.]